jgi:hypothetical protein
MVDDVNLVTFSGSFREMGKQYGNYFKDIFPDILGLLFKFFCGDHSLDKALLEKESESLYQRFPKKYQEFIVEAAQAASISLADMKVLNAMETFIGLIKKNHLGNCSFVGVSSRRSKLRRVIIGRNYDYPKPFDLCVKYLSVVVLKETNKIPVAVITIPGQIYCPTGINAEGVFCSLNNGMESGGKEVNQESVSLLTSLLDGLQTHNSAKDFSRYLDNITTDFSLIINSADKESIYSNEFSSVYGVKSYVNKSDDVFISTNFFKHSDWQLPMVDDKRTGYSVTRYNNLSQSTKGDSCFDIDDIKELLDYRIRDLEKPGATWKNTIYQVVCDPEMLVLYIKRPHIKNIWQRIDLLF